MPRRILHLDLDAFFCAVEELFDPSLQGKAFAVGGSPDGRGVVASCSYPARAFGVHSAMPMSQAVRICPELIVVSHGHGRYGEMSAKVMERLREVSGLVEQISIDEAFVDISDMGEESLQIAQALQGRVNNELKLPCSIGIASNKLVAKIATDAGKYRERARGGYPNAITIVPLGNEESFLAPLPVNSLWGVGPKTEARLKTYGISSIGDLAKFSEKRLEELFGEHGRDLYKRCRGIDQRPVSEGHTAKSVSQERTFRQDVSDFTELERVLRKLSFEVGRNLRKEGLAGMTVKLKLRWSDFTTITRQMKLDTPTVLDEEIFASALLLLRAHRPAGKAVRLIGVGVSSLVEPVRQLGLFDQKELKRMKLQKALDELQEKFGNKSITRGKEKR